MAKKENSYSNDLPSATTSTGIQMYTELHSPSKLLFDFIFNLPSNEIQTRIIQNGDWEKVDTIMSSFVETLQKCDEPRES